ncbi:MAG: HEAT repeat domain-containing protein [Planctomycetes bacterium]|nr:HEAT repeat domain-containing protein [Planctomycetota bacterium]
MKGFEELAADLAHGASARERIAAAEQLAGLDDPRVAPTLARALADPDPSVRERVEALLGEFARRDRQGHLGALLAEAERVAAALAAEAQRLRGAAPEEPSAHPVEPLPPPEGFDGPCAIVRLTGGAMDLKRVSRLVGGAVGLPPFEVARGVQATKGFLARGVPAATARKLVAQLAEAGVTAGALPMDALPEPLKPHRLREPGFGADALRGRLLPTGEESVPWPSVELAVAARVEMDLEPRALEEDWSSFTRPLRPRAQRRADQEPVYDHIIEVFAAEPPRRLRLVTYELDFSVMARRPARFSRVARMARELFRRMDRARAAAGIRRLADLDEENWHDLTFTSPVGYEDYVAWQRLLLSLGVPLPV